ncbi:MAG: hypothetical protein ACRDBX_06840 [Erysipelotrichaceae bacterium]
MKINGKRMGVTLTLTAVIIGLFLAIFALFVSGPQKHAEAKLAAQLQNIQAKEQYQEVYRDVFRYTTFVAFDNTHIDVYDVNGKRIARREQSAIDEAGAKTQATALFQMQVESWQVGYGFEGPVYVLKEGNKTLLLDFDTKAFVYYYEGDYN